MNAPQHDAAITDKWDARELGASDDHVVVASEADSLALDAALSMKLISIRLPIPLIEALKSIAAHHEIAYQPMIRDLLTRFARSEVRQIMCSLDKEMENAQQTDQSMAPVDSFMAQAQRYG